MTLNASNRLLWNYYFIIYSNFLLTDYLPDAFRQVNLSPKVFKHCAVPLLQIICHLFYTSISSSTIPHDWCTHCVVLIHKSGDKSSLSNYRPILLLCILSKVLKRVVYNNIIDYVSEKVTKHQFGFLPKRSTIQQLLVFTEKVVEQKCETDVIYYIIYRFQKSL